MNLGVRLWFGPQHSPSWLILAHFLGYCSPFWSLGAFSKIDETQGTIMGLSSTLIVLADSGLFVGYCSQFWGPRAFSIIDEPKGALTGCHQHSQFWLILAHFVAYCSPLWGPRAIFVVDKPRGAIIGQSLRLRVLADFALFCGQLQILLGSRNNF